MQTFFLGKYIENSCDMNKTKFNKLLKTADKQLNN